MVCFLAVSVSVTYVSNLALLFSSVALIILQIYLKVSPMRQLKEIRVLLVFLIALIIIRTFSYDAVNQEMAGGLAISEHGFFDGLIFSWRILLVVFWSSLFIRTTRIADVKAAIQWFLKPVPFIPEKRVATMVSLMVRFLPEILTISGEVSEAQQARCVRNRKNPIYRLKTFLLPFTYRVFTVADQLSDSMAARCYTEDRTDLYFTTEKNDWLVLALTAMGVFIMSLI